MLSSSTICSMSLEGAGVKRHGEDHLDELPSKRYRSHVDRGNQLEPADFCPYAGEIVNREEDAKSLPLNVPFRAKTSYTTHNIDDSATRTNPAELIVVAELDNIVNDCLGSLADASTPAAIIEALSWYAKRIAKVLPISGAAEPALIPYYTSQKLVALSGLSNSPLTTPGKISISQALEDTIILCNNAATGALDERIKSAMSLGCTISGFIRGGSLPPVRAIMSIVQILDSVANTWSDYARGMMAT